MAKETQRLDLIEIALSQYGEREIKGKYHNNKIVSFAKESGFNWVNNDETPWCSIFMNWVAMKGGYERTKKANARSWLDIGEKINEPEMGDLVVFKVKGSETAGHVALFVKRDKGFLYVLGGNQSDSVVISRYYDSNVIGYRRLKKLELIDNS